MLRGRIEDAASGAPVTDAVVTVTSPSLPAEEIAVTDTTGAYRIQDLPPGLYTLRIERESYQPYAHEGLDLHADATIQLDAALLPEMLQAEEIVVVGKTPTVDVGSSAIGLNITSELTNAVPVAMPGSKGAAARSFEAIAEMTPGAQTDAFGVAFQGSSSPENRYLLDGLSVSNATYGVLATPLSIDFIKEVSVISGGYLPEYGRSTGGILNAITKTGSNEFHGSTFFNIAPGGLEGPRKTPFREGDSIVTNPKLNHMADIGADIGGPILKDKLWFYLGLDFARTRYDVRRTLRRQLFAADGTPETDSAGNPRWQNIPGTERTWAAEQDMLQAIGKLTWTVNDAHRVTLTLNGVYPRSGGDGAFGISPLTGQPLLGNENRLNGTYDAIAHRYSGNSTNAILKWAAELNDDKSMFLDTWLGWHNGSGGRLPSDGSGIGSSRGLAGISNVWWLRPGHSLTDFERVPGGSCDAPTNNPEAVVCPVSDYHTGGPEFIDQQIMNRVQARSILTKLFEGFGHHILKVGIDSEFQIHDGKRAYTGARDYVEYPDFPIFLDGRVYGYLTGPDQPVVLDSIHSNTRSLSLGAFVQDSWNIDDRVTLNLGIRYDAQFLYGPDNALAMSLPNQWSPRIGVVYDPTQSGRAKFYTNFARYFESVPLRMLDRYLSGEPLLQAARDPAVCNPLIPAQQQNECLSDAAVLPLAGYPPNARYDAFSSSTSVIDPALRPPSTDEFVLGVDYEIMEDSRLGLAYTKRWLNDTIEDMSRDGGSTFFFGNPGRGIARDFPSAQRRYDAFNLQFSKRMSHGWIAQASYTLSWLRGNYSGLFRPEDQQFDPHQSADFDVKDLYTNRVGPLPGDRRHFIKLFGAKQFDLPSDFGYVMPGLAVRAYSGEPTNLLGAYGQYIDNVYIEPRGSGERLPWTCAIDLRLAYGLKLDKDRSIALTVDIFNLFNFQSIAARDERYTASDVRAVQGGRAADLTNADGTPFDPEMQRNANFGKATAYQPPRIFRFGLKGTF
ncbi:MAG TPA: TonB-dependent receptor [Polyangiales bacterium]|nr:TonB-dependent receptor [Polyangiales bacterium]